MRNPKTLFIIGAGASEEVGLPIGKKLIELVANRLNFVIKNGAVLPDFGDSDILDIFQQLEKTREGIEAYFQAAKQVRDGVILSNSIDSFIDVHKDNQKIQLCGKLAIAKTILDAERESMLAQGLDKIQDTWFFEFAKNLNDGVRKTEIQRIFEKVSFIIFNYDRCFEHFMISALQRHYGIGEDEACSVMKTLKIIHPYGTIADLPWQNSKEGIPFGMTANRENMKLMASRIRTYTEQVKEADMMTAIHHLVSEADTLVFLGFSYHPENMKLLNPERDCAVKQIYGTAYKISASNVGVIQDNLQKSIGRHIRVQHKNLNDNSVMTWQPIHIHDLKCSQLLQEYSRSLFIGGRSNN